MDPSVSSRLNESFCVTNQWLLFAGKYDFFVILPKFIWHMTFHYVAMYFNLILIPFPGNLVSFEALSSSFNEI